VIPEAATAANKCLPSAGCGGPRLAVRSTVLAMTPCGDASESSESVRVAGGPRKALYLAAAGGCFVMSFVGVVTPGIPTVPFVLATSFFLVRSSPMLNRRLRQSRMFGPMVRDWEEHRGLRRGTKIRVLLFSALLMGVTLLFGGHSMTMFYFAACMSCLGIGVVVWLPTVAERPEVEASELPVD
jgi:uncharacterized protein